MIGRSKNNKKIIHENDFEHKEKKPRLNANRPSNNWALLNKVELMTLK